MLDTTVEVDKLEIVVLTLFYNLCKVLKLFYIVRLFAFGNAVKS